MAVGDIYQVNLFWNAGSELTMNVIHFKEKVVCTDDLPAKTVAKVVHNRFDDIVGNTVFSNETRVTAIQVRRIKPQAGTPFLAIIGTVEFPEIVGTGVGDPLPSTTAGLVSFYTATNTKSGRGRMYLPGMASGIQNDGQLLETPLTTLSGNVAALEDTQVSLAGDTGEWLLCVFSRKNQVGHDIVNVITHSNLATQRGRRNFPGIGQ